MSPEQLLAVLIPLAAAALIFMRNRKPRRLHPGRMWIMPLLVALLVGVGVYFTPRQQFGPAVWAGFAAALILGGIVGWWRAKTIQITCTEDGRHYARASPLGLMLLLGLFAARRGDELLIEQEGAAWRLHAAAATDALLLFAAALVIAQRLEMWLRARRVAREPATA